MTNLIPPDAKKAVRREYWTRVLSVWAFLLAGALVVFSALTLPTYVLYESQITGFELEEKMSETGSSNNYDQALEEITRANELALQLSRNPATLDASALLDAVEAAQGEMIRLDRFSYDRSQGRVESITLGGVAANRTSLAGFSEALKRQPLFIEAAVPVSSLVRERDLPFEITVEVNQERN